MHGSHIVLNSNSCSSNQKAALYSDNAALYAKISSYRIYSRSKIQSLLAQILLEGSHRFVLGKA